MTLSVSHAFSSAIPDGGDTTLVEPSDWNAAHVVAGSVTVAGVVPIGALVDWAGTVASVPSNWLFCDGASLLRAGTYADLFSAIGTTWGAADGTHFSIPDTRDMYIVGAKQDDSSIPKSNIRGSLEQSASATGVTLTHDGSVGNHPSLAHAGVALADHPSLTHAGFTPTAHPTGSLSHAAANDHAAFTPSAHATAGLTHAGFTASTHPTTSLSHAAANDHAAFTASAHATAGLTHAGFTASGHPTGSLTHAANADHAAFTASAHATSGLTHAAITAATGSKATGGTAITFMSANTASFAHAALSHDGVAAQTHLASSNHPSLSHDGFASANHAALSHDGQAALTHLASFTHPALAHDGAASSNHAALSHDGFAALTHLGSTTHPALSHDGIASAAHGAASHAITQADAHGAVTHSFTPATQHTASIVPNFLAMPKIIRYA